MNNSSLNYNKNPRDDGLVNKTLQGQPQISLGAEKNNMYRLREPNSKVDAKNTLNIYG